MMSARPIRSTASVSSRTEGTVGIVADVRAKGSHRLEQAVEDHWARAAVVANAAEDRVPDPAERGDLGDDPQAPVGVVSVARRELAGRHARERGPEPVDRRHRGERVVDRRRQRAQGHLDELPDAELDVILGRPNVSDDERRAKIRGHCRVHSLARPRHDQRVALHDEEAGPGFRRMQRSYRRAASRSAASSTT